MFPVHLVPTPAKFARQSPYPYADHLKTVAVGLGDGSVDFVAVVDESLLSAIDVTDGLKSEGTIVINSSRTVDEIMPYLNGFEGNVVVVDAQQISEDTLGIAT